MEALEERSLRAARAGPVRGVQQGRRYQGHGTLHDMQDFLICIPYELHRCFYSGVDLLIL
jgi:hypothetical protein